MPKRHSHEGRKYYKRCRRCHHKFLPSGKPSVPLPEDPIPEDPIPGPGLGIGSSIGQVIGRFSEPGPFNFRDFRQARRILAIIWGGGGGGNSFNLDAIDYGGGSSGLAYVEFDVTERIEVVTGSIGKGGRGGTARYTPTSIYNRNNLEMTIILGQDGTKSVVDVAYRPPGPVFRQIYSFTAFGGTRLNGGTWLADGPLIPSEFKSGGENGTPGSNPTGNNGGSGSNAPSLDGHIGSSGGTGGISGAGGPFDKGKPGQQPGGGGGGGSRNLDLRGMVYYTDAGTGGNGLVLFIRLA